MKLCAYRKSLVENLIQQIELMQSKASEAYYDIKVIDTEIANLATQKLVVTRLHSSGALNPSEYKMQSTELEHKISGLRSKRKRLIAMDESDSMLDELRTLNKTISEYSPNNKFDAELFETIVEDITVKNCSEITYKLIGGIELTEIIIEKGRCKTA